MYSNSLFVGRVLVSVLLFCVCVFAGWLVSPPFSHKVVGQRLPRVVLYHGVLFVLLLFCFALKPSTS
jgi:hypothetical protein